MWSKFRFDVVRLATYQILFFKCSWFGNLPIWNVHPRTLRVRAKLSLEELTGCAHSPLLMLTCSPSTQKVSNEQLSTTKRECVCVCVGVWVVCLFLNLNYEWVATVLNSLIWYYCTVFGNAKLAGIKYFRLNLASYWNNVFGEVVALGMAHLLNYLATGWRTYRVTSKI